MIEPQIIQGDARDLHMIPGESVDLIVTSPPYFGLRDYGMAGQLGAEPTSAEYVDALVECTREMVRVLKPSGSIFVNLGDKYAPSKSLHLLPERYRIACTDELGLIARAVIVWSKPNGLPESVTDRVRRSHEDWVHLTRSPRYFSAVDEIREPHTMKPQRRGTSTPYRDDSSQRHERQLRDEPATDGNPLGKLPGSVWEIATQPLRVPAELGVDHFAAFPMEWPRRLILGWSPPGGVVLDPFGGTGTTALVAAMHGRQGISVDMSADYCRLAEWRVNDPKQRERASRPAGSTRRPGVRVPVDLGITPSAESAGSVAPARLATGAVPVVVSDRRPAEDAASLDVSDDVFGHDGMVSRSHLATQGGAA